MNAAANGISVVIPAFNEAENIEATVLELVGALSAAGFADCHEIIIVDDHSSDDTYGTVQRMGRPDVRCIRLSRRCGSHIALRAGLAQASRAAALCISADGQDNPSVLAEMMRRLQAGAHVVWALRTRRDEPFMQKFLAMTFYRLLQSMVTSQNPEFDMSRADFYLLSRRAVDSINACPERNTSLFGLVEWMGFRQECVEYERRVRRAGESKWPVKRRLSLAWSWITAFSGLPLRMIAVLGIAIALAGFLYAAFVFVYALCGKTIPGFAATAILILILNGIQLTMLGIIGEYLWRNIEESRRRPLYFIESETAAAGAAQGRNA